MPRGSWSALPLVLAACASPPLQERPPEQPVLRANAPAAPTASESGASATGSRPLAGADGGARGLGRKAKLVIGSVLGGPPDAPATLLRGKDGFNNCLQLALDDGFEVARDLILTLQIGADGSVRSASSTAPGSVPPTLVTCVETHSKTLRFSATTPADSKLEVQLGFFEQ